MPGRALATAIKKLKGAIPDSTQAFMEQYHKEVVEHLQSKSDESHLVSKLPQVKAIGANPQAELAGTQEEGTQQTV